MAAGPGENGMPRHFVSFTQSGVMPLTGAGASVCAMPASVQLGMGLAARVVWSAPLGGKACTIVPPRKARPRSISSIQRRGCLHMAGNIVLLSGKSNIGVCFGSGG